MNVLLIAMGPTPPGDNLISGVLALTRAGARVDLVSRHPPGPELAQALAGVHPLPAGRMSGAPAGGLSRGLSRRTATVVARLPGPLRKLRLDPDRLPGAVRVLRRRASADLVAAADVVVALDAAAVPAAWLAAHRHRDLIALSGLPAAVNRLTG